MDVNRRHRAATMFLFFVLLLGGLGLLTADLSAGQPKKVQGVVTEAGNPINLLPGVNVTLRDAHGQKDPLVFLTGGDGAYTFSPPPGFYQVIVTKPGFFDANTTIFRFDNTANVIENLEMEKMQPTNRTLTVHVEEMGTMAPIDNATVDLFNVTMDQVVATNLTNSTGNTTFPVWNGTFQLWVEKDGFAREVTNVTITMDTMITVTLANDIKLVGIARDEDDGTLVDAGLVAFLYNTDAGTPKAKRLLVASVTGSSYTFFAYVGNFTLIVDANGMAANFTSVTDVSASRRVDTNLTTSLDEGVHTVIRYTDGDWERLNFWRNLSLNEDSTFPGLPFAFIRNLRLQIDLALGDGDGTMDTTERDDFRKFLEKAGPKDVDTDGFFTTNSFHYLSDLVNNTTDYAVCDFTPKPPCGTATSSFPLTSGPVDIASVANYTVPPESGTIDANQEKYFVNVTASHDTEAEVRVNTTYTIQRVPGYERVVPTITLGTVDIQGFVFIEIDPSVASGDFTVEMVVAKSVAGTARVLVVAPPDRFTETNASVENYTAIVPTNISMTFSAEESTDPNSLDGRVNPDSTFNWTFTNLTTTQTENATGIRPNNVTFSVMGNYTGNLKIVEVGGNETFRDFNLSVDGILPIARLEHNMTLTPGMDANNTTLSINEGEAVEFFAGNSTDQVHNEMVGVVRSWRWDFDGDGVVDATGRSVDWTFDEPGEFTVNLTVVDQAGHESLNATMTAMVVDTSPPEVAFRILDEDFQEVTSLVEKVTYFFDGSDTTDNLDDLQNMTFTWDFDDGNTTTGVNVTHAYDRFGNYDAALTVTDQAGNEGNATRSVVVGVDPEARPDLEIEPNVMHIDPASPEESTFLGTVTLFITFNVTNKPDRARANDVRVTFFAFQFGQSPGNPIPITPVFRDANGNATSKTLEAGETKTVEFTWITGPLGNYTLRANVTDPEEPDLFIGPRNSVELQMDVREAGWKQPLLIGSIVAVIVGIPLALYLRRRRGLRGRGRERITR